MKKLMLLYEIFLEVFMKIVDFIRDRMRFTQKWIFYIALLTFLTMGMSVKVYAHHGHEHRHHYALELGIELEGSFWTFVQEQHVERFAHQLSFIFQGNSPTGIYDREDQISGLTGIDLISFSLNRPIATMNIEGDTLVFSYLFDSFGGNLVNGPSVSVWHKNILGQWKLVSHSYFPGPAS